MPRVKRSVHAKKKRRKVLKGVSGMRGARGRLYTIATEALDRALAYAYAHRRRKKRDFRRLWIARINAAARINGITYNRLIEGLAKANVALDRKTLSEMALKDPSGFSRITEVAKKSLSL